jgi:hypothetical protein
VERRPEAGDRIRKCKEGRLFVNPAKGGLKANKTVPGMLDEGISDWVFVDETLPNRHSRLPDTRGAGAH